MRNSLCYSYPFPDRVKWVNYVSRFFKTCCVVLFVLFSKQSLAQTFNCPSASRCTSKDLSIVGVFLTGGSCSCSATGTQTATLNMSINNTTGSTRTSFAFFGSLVKTGPGGSITPISGCGGPLPPNSITTIVVGTVTYNCNQTLSLSNVFLAWTDAAGTTATRCAEILADACVSIAPKCGTAAVIPIRPLLSFTFSTVEGCTGQSDGSITITPVGGVSPYRVTLNGVTRTGVTGSTQFTGLAANTYPVSVRDGASTPCTYTANAVLTSRFCCTTPTVNGNPSNVSKCVAQPASFTASSTGGNPTPTVQWQLSADGGSSWTNLSNASPYSNVTTTTMTVNPVSSSLNGHKYRAVFTSVGCAPATSNAATLTVNALPVIPDVTYNPAACDETTFSLTIGSAAKPILAGAVYRVFDKNGQTIPGISPSSPHTATAQEVTNNQIVFSNILCGLGYRVDIESSSGCVPSGAALGCGSSPSAVKKTTSPLTGAIAESQTSVKVYPNPFNDRVRFVITSPVAGNGNLDVFNMTGQKIKTVYTGYIAGGSQSFEMNIPASKLSTLVYVLRMGDKLVTGKLLQLGY